MNEITERFLEQMKFYSSEYWDLAGCDDYFDYQNDYDVIGGDVAPGTGDHIVIDRRGCGDTYGLCHDCANIYPIKVIKNSGVSGPVDTYEITDVKDFDLQFFAGYKNQDFQKLLAQFKQCLDIGDEAEDLSGRLIQPGLKLLQDACFSDDRLESVEDLDSAIRQLDEDYYEDVMVFVAMLLAFYILVNHDRPEELRESLKIMLSGELCDEDNSPFIAELSYVKILTLFELERKQDAYKIIRRVQAENYLDDDLFQDYYDLDEYIEWLRVSQPLVGPDNFNFYLPGQPGPISLIDRFRRIGHLFLAIRDQKEVCEYDWNILLNASRRYDEEKAFFEHDYHLVLYWLLYFGMTADQRYQDVEVIAEQQEYRKKMKMFGVVLDFFSTRNDFVMSVPHEQ
ncbi:hypothetical protein [Vibrio quintilis]|uniref:Uncharacterized protein n=1 Tax=Vibrio quintilis TaxID=1117707 RepID=A0A1M7YRI8_9VIBR|nr:hypothetical protein [Vibrio quintilis]SHO55156.1 hypothetical protein VQ7734_00875 [Vibrio quintilis]